MSDFPLQPIIMTVGAFAVVGIVMLNRKRTLASQDTQYAQYRVGALAQRLGLGVVQGDPDFNLFIRNANAEFDRNPTDDEARHVEVQLAGTREGLPMSLHYLHRVEQETSIGKVTRTKYTDCRLTVQAKQAFPAFEVASKNAPMGPIVRKLNAPRQPIGDATLDATYEVYSTEPGVAQALRGVLPLFATFANSGVHLVGDDRDVSFVMKEDKAPILANALYYAEDMGKAVTAVARALGG